ncbi:MAG: hypothetical protein F4Z19_07040 [Holophagales bacterium]|nr:hypothetical protein [Holophagales bacterium]
MDEAAAKRSEAARKAWVTRKRTRPSRLRTTERSGARSLLAEAKAELEEAERRYKATEYLVDQFRRLKEAAKQPAALAVLVLALFLLPAEAQVNMELEEEYPLSRAVAYESVSFMLNRTLRSIPDVPDELIRRFVLRPLKSSIWAGRCEPQSRTAASFSQISAARRC